MVFFLFSIVVVVVVVLRAVQNEGQNSALCEFEFWAMKGYAMVAVWLILCCQLNGPAEKEVENEIGERWAIKRFGR